MWEQLGDVLWCREIAELKRATFAEHDATMDDIVRRFNVVRLAMDQTGMGEKPVEDAKRRYGGSRVDGVIFTQPAKLDLAIAGKEAFEDRRVRIPEGDLVLRADLHKIQKVVGPTGIPRLVAERDSAGHADRAWACFLGVAAADGGGHAYDYAAAPTPAARFGEPSDWSEDEAAPARTGLAHMRGAW